MRASTLAPPPGLFSAGELPLPAAPRRLFTALLPDAAARAAVDAQRRRWVDQQPDLLLPARARDEGVSLNGGGPHPALAGGRAALHPVPERLHVTLQCFNQVPAPTERAWHQCLRSLRFEAFEIVFDRAEPWRVARGELIVVLCAAPQPALAALHRATARLARQAGLPAAMQGFKPHLTALRFVRAAQPLPLSPPIRWTVRAVDLVWSDLHARPPRYHPLGRFLAG